MKIERSNFSVKVGILEDNPRGQDIEDIINLLPGIMPPEKEKQETTLQILYIHRYTSHLPPIIEIMVRRVSIGEFSGNENDADGYYIVKVLPQIGARPAFARVIKLKEDGQGYSRNITGFAWDKESEKSRLNKAARLNIYMF